MVFVLCNELIFKQIEKLVKLTALYKDMVIISVFFGFHFAFAEADAFSMFTFSLANICFYVFVNDVHKKAKKNGKSYLEIVVTLISNVGNEMQDFYFQ